MNPSLKKGAWNQLTPCLAFKIVLHRFGVSNHWDPSLSRKIFMILHTEEIRERYLSGLPPLKPSEKLDLPLDDIINPIRALEEKYTVGFRWAKMANCHPGRLTLNPEAYHHAYTLSMSMGQTEVPWIMRCGGWVQDGWMIKGWAEKHRLLDIPEIETSMAAIRNGHVRGGLQDVYFLGGLPLIYWSERNGAMGMKVSMMQFNRPPTPSAHNGMVVNSNRRYIAGFQWRGSKDLSEYKRMWYIPTERDFYGPHGPPDDWDPFNRAPRTSRDNTSWIDRHAGGKAPVDMSLDGANDDYISYVQLIEDWDDWNRLSYSEENVQTKTLGGW